MGGRRYLTLHVNGLSIAQCEVGPALVVGYSEDDIVNEAYIGTRGATLRVDLPQGMDLALARDGLACPIREPTTI
jgi:hypothetical protein